jgi:hypothetical protein
MDKHQNIFTYYGLPKDACLDNLHVSNGSRS